MNEIQGAIKDCSIQLQRFILQASKPQGNIMKGKKRIKKKRNGDLDQGLGCNRQYVSLAR